MKIPPLTSPRPLLLSLVLAVLAHLALAAALIGSGTEGQRLLMMQALESLMGMRGG